MSRWTRLLRRRCRWVAGAVLAVFLAGWLSRWWWAPPLAVAALRPPPSSLLVVLSGAVGDASVPGLMAAWLDASRINERIIASSMLGRMHTPRARVGLVTLLMAGKSTVPPSHLTVTLAQLCGYDDPIANAVLFQLAADSTWPAPTRRYAVGALLSHDPPGLEALVAQLIRLDTDGTLADIIMLKLGPRKDRTLDSLLEMYLEHRDPNVRESAARMLERRRVRR